MTDTKISESLYIDVYNAISNVNAWLYDISGYATGYRVIDGITHLANVTPIMFSLYMRT